MSIAEKNKKINIASPKYTNWPGKECGETLDNIIVPSVDNKTAGKKRPRSI